MKKFGRHLLFVLSAAACVHLPLFAMYLAGAGPVSYVLFYYPPFTLVPAGALVLGLCAGVGIKKYWYVPVLVPAAFLFSFYGAFQPLWAGGYLLLGVAAMLVCHCIRRLAFRRQPKEVPHAK